MLKKLCLTTAAFALTVAASITPAVSGPKCPDPQPYEGGCIQVIVTAKSPSGQCCEYPNPCSVPAGWTIYYGPNCTDPIIIEG